ncbi:hypothetical protein L204_106435 [Cryptococcus depauperatus]|nr:hypothetical protein L204_06176 [Cryptococcus depauperatus CBS 7855]
MPSPSGGLSLFPAVSNRTIDRHNALYGVMPYEEHNFPMPPRNMAPSSPEDPLKGMKDSRDNETQNPSTTDGNYRSRAGTFIETLHTNVGDHLRSAARKFKRSFKFGTILSPRRKTLETEGGAETNDQHETLPGTTRGRSATYDGSECQSGLTGCERTGTESQGVVAIMQTQQRSTSEASQIAPTRARSATNPLPW